MNSTDSILISGAKVAQHYETSKQTAQKVQEVCMTMTNIKPFHSKVRKAASISRIRLRFGEWGE